MQIRAKGRPSLCRGESKGQRGKEEGSEAGGRPSPARARGLGQGHWAAGRQETHAEGYQEAQNAGAQGLETQIKPRGRAKDQTGPLAFSKRGQRRRSRPGRQDQASRSQGRQELAGADTPPLPVWRTVHLESSETLELYKTRAKPQPYSLPCHPAATATRVCVCGRLNYRSTQEQR